MAADLDTTRDRMRLVDPSAVGVAAKSVDRGAWIAGALVFAFLAVFHSGRVLLGTNDEGIYLDAAQRMVEGQRPYVDFWGYMSPGSFWNHELSFRLAGITQWAGRLPVISSFALECGVVFALVALLASRGAAVFSTILFFAFQTARLTVLTSQHRWESGALAALAVLLVLRGTVSSRPALLAVAGVATGYAVVCTPSMAILAVITVGWLVVTGRRGRPLYAYVAGGIAVGLAAVAVMYAGGYLGGFWEEMRWLSRKYSNVNVMSYGSIIGGYSSLFSGISAVERVVRLIVLFFLVLPATLPPLAVAGWACILLRRGATPLPSDLMIYLLLALAGLVATAFPRADVEHLGFVAALPYALAGALAACQFRPAVRLPLVGLLAFGAALFCWNSWSPLLGDRGLQTPVGNVRAAPDEAREVEALLKVVRPGNSLYVHPYRPLFYFLTQARNPSRYSYLAPGMMDHEDEREVLAQLDRQPPQWVLFLELTPEEYLRVFPSGRTDQTGFIAIEKWIRAGYAPTALSVGSGYRLWAKK